MAKKSSAKNRPKKRRKKGTKQIPKGWKALWPFVAFIAATSLVAMAPVINADFTELDDKRLIIESMPKFLANPMWVWDQALFTAHYKPLVILSWVVEAKLFGVNTKAFHAVNLLVHTINSVLVFFLALRLFSQFEPLKNEIVLASVGAACLFAVHPLHVEPVAWAIGRKDLYYTMFVLLGFLSYLRYLKEGWKWMIPVALTFLAALLCKAPAVMFPFLLFVIDWAYRRPIAISTIVEKIPVFAVLAVGLYLFGFFGGGSSVEDISMEGRIGNIAVSKPAAKIAPLDELPALYGKAALLCFKGVLWYVHSWLPVKLALAYPYMTWLPRVGQGIHAFVVLFLAAGGVLFYFRNRFRLLFFTHALFIIALVPALIRTGIGTGIFLSDRYTYLALLGFVMFVSGGLAMLMSRRKWPESRRRVALGALIAVLGIMSFRQASIWDNGETLWTHNINNYPSVAYAYSNRGLYYKEQGQMDKAMADFGQASELNDDKHALLNRALMLRSEGKFDEAMRDINKVLERSPGDSYALSAKGNLLFTQQKYREAIEVYNQGLQYNPDDHNIRLNRGVAYYYLRDTEAALADFSFIERANPNYKGLYSKMTVVYNTIGDWENVAKYARLTAEQEPNNHAALGDLGTALQNLGRHQEAIDAFTRALQVFPRGERYYRGRAVSYQAIGNTSAAQADIANAEAL